MQRFTELRVWQRSHALALDVYRITATFPEAERFGIISQVRRAAVSIASNIAEGAKRQSRREHVRFLNVAESSLAETESLRRLSYDLGLADVQWLANWSKRLRRSRACCMASVKRLNDVLRIETCEL